MGEEGIMVDVSRVNTNPPSTNVFDYCELKPDQHGYKICESFLTHASDVYQQVVKKLRNLIDGKNGIRFDSSGKQPKLKDVCPGLPVSPPSHDFLPERISHTFQRLHDCRTRIAYTMTTSRLLSQPGQDFHDHLVVLRETSSMGASIGLTLPAGTHLVRFLVPLRQNSRVIEVRVPHRQYEVFESKDFCRIGEQELGMTTYRNTYLNAAGKEFHLFEVKIRPLKIRPVEDIAMTAPVHIRFVAFDLPAMVMGGSDRCQEK